MVHPINVGAYDNKTNLLGRSMSLNDKQWDKFQIRARLGKIDVLTIEIDISRQFYLFTLFNFTMKNR